ncbi:glycosyltransferase [Alphaproteobacteria bacterium]|nr:glycosyltransferase [Alphaproteobacteria bacterium]
MARLIIDASRAISGGGIIHLKKFLEFLNTTNMKEKPLVICHKLHTAFISKDKFETIILHRKLTSILFQMLILPFICVIQKANLINLDASSFNFYPAKISISRDAQSFEKNIISMYSLNSLKFLRYLFIKWLQIFQLRRSKQTVYLTHYHKILITKFTKCNYKKGVIIPHGVEENIINTFKHKAYKNGDPIKIIYVSNLAPYKRHDVLAKAIFIVDQLGYHVRLQLIGDTKPSYIHDEVIRFSNAMPFKSSIEILGSQPQQYVLNQIKKSDLAIFSSECETFSNILREKVALGIPIICAGVNPFFEVAGKFAQYYNHNEPYDLALKIIDFIKLKIKKNSELNKIDRAEFFKGKTWPDCIFLYEKLLKEYCQEIYSIKSGDKNVSN